MISQHEIDTIVDATDIVSLVSEYVKLEKRGKNYMGLCPFHNEDTPSFVVSPEKKLAHCFGCGGGGNVIKFVQDIEHLEFQEAVAFLAKRANISISYQSNEKKNPTLDKYYNIMNVATDFYVKYLNNSKSGLEALDYLHKRGLSDEIIQKFKIGLAPMKNDALYQVLKEAGFLELDMMDLALVDKNPKGYYDIFQKRIMFPICDEAGHVIAFSGRIFNTTDKSQPKYINSRETLIFKKGSTMFNIQNAKGEIQKKKRVILHEGQMDVIAAYKAGFTEAICTLGTALSDEHAKILKRYASSAVICYDGDGAGVRASLKAIKVFARNGFNVHLVLLPDGKDPDEYVLAYGEKAYQEYFESHLLDANHYIFEQAVLKKDFTDGIVCENVKKEVFEMIASANSNTVAEEFLTKLSSIMKVSKEALTADYNIYASHNRPAKPTEINYYPEDVTYPQEDVIPVVAKKKRMASRAEERLFMYARQSKNQALYIDNMINDKLDAFSIEGQSIWNTLIYSYYENKNTFSEHDFLMMIDPQYVNYYIEIMDEIKSDSSVYNDKDLQDCIAKLEELRLSKKNKSLEQKFQNADDRNKLRLLDDMFKNKKQKDIIKKTNRRK